MYLSDSNSSEIESKSRLQGRSADEKGLKKERALSHISIKCFGGPATSHLNKVRGCTHLSE
jgi:hypothetical protein